MPKVRREFVDADYIDKLNPEEKAWYGKFIEEYVGANVKKNKKTRNIAKGHLHKTKHIKELYDANNHRNNDVYGVTKINGLLTHYEDMPGDLGKLHRPELVEEALIAIIDRKDYLPEDDKSDT